MRPTGRGVLFLAVAVLLYLLARQTTIGWFYVADAAMWAAALLNLVVPWWSLRGLDAHRALERQARDIGQGLFEGDKLSILLTVANSGRAPRALVTMEERCPIAPPGEERRRFLVETLASRSQVAFAYETACYQRGEYAFGPLRVEAAIPFGLFRAWRSLEAPLRLLIYPQVLDFGAARPRGEAIEPLSVPVPARSTGDFRATREYLPGDTLRHIHWKGSARRGALMVKQFDATPEPQTGVLFDATRSFGAGKETTFEYAIKVAAALGCASFRTGGSFLMAPPGPSVRFFSVRPLLEFLARLQAKPQAATLADALRSWPRRRVGAAVAVVSAADREGLHALAHQAAGKVGAVVLLRGFAPQEEAADSWEQLQPLAARGVPVIPCQPGTLRAALDALSASSARSGRRAIPARR